MEQNWRHTVCQTCGQDIEGDLNAADPDWRDRGSGTTVAAESIARVVRDMMTPPLG